MGISEDVRFTEAINDENNKKIISRLVSRYRRKYPHILDEPTLESAVSLSVLKALRNYDISKKTAFSSFLYVALRWELQDAVRLLGKQANSFRGKFPSDIEDLPNSNDLFDLDPIIKAILVDGASVISIEKTYNVSRKKIKNKLNHFIERELEHGGR